MQIPILGKRQTNTQFFFTKDGIDNNNNKVVFFLPYGQNTDSRVSTPVMGLTPLRSGRLHNKGMVLSGN